VDIHLEKYSKALRNLSQAGESFFDQTIDLMEKHRLYSDAVEVYAGQPDNLNVVLSRYAAHLIKLGQLEEAGMSMLFSSLSLLPLIFDRL
jgi:elongator complex protein 1